MLGYLDAGYFWNVKCQQVIVWEGRIKIIIKNV